MYAQERGLPLPGFQTPGGVKLFITEFGRSWILILGSTDCFKGKLQRPPFAFTSFTQSLKKSSPPRRPLLCLGLFLWKGFERENFINRSHGSEFFLDELFDAGFLIIIAAHVYWVLVTRRALLNAFMSCLFSNLKPKLDSILGPILWTCAGWYRSHSWRVALEHLKCGWSSLREAVKHTADFRLRAKKKKKKRMWTI